MSAWTPGRRILDYALAGLQTGVLGGLLALGWYAFSSVWQGQPVLAAPVSLGTSLAGDGFRRGYGFTALTGASLQVAVSGTLGVLFGLIVRSRDNVLRAMLLGILFGLACYWLCYGLLWQKLLAADPLPASSRTVLVAHLLFGAHLGRYPQVLHSVRGYF
jgi:hypothetical protein